MTSPEEPNNSTQVNSICKQGFEKPSLSRAQLCVVLQLTNKFLHASTCLSTYCLFSVSFLTRGKRASEQRHHLPNEMTSSTQCCLRIKLGLFINISGLNHHNKIPALELQSADLLWNLNSAYIGKCLIDPQNFVPQSWGSPHYNHLGQKNKNKACCIIQKWDVK